MKFLSTIFLVVLSYNLFAGDLVYKTDVKMVYDGCKAFTMPEQLAYAHEAACMNKGFSMIMGENPYTQAGLVLKSCLLGYNDQEELYCYNTAIRISGNEELVKVISKCQSIIENDQETACYKNELKRLDSTMPSRLIH